MNRLRIHCLQHVSFEEPAYLEVWAERHNVNLRRTLLNEGEALPNIDDFDCLVVLGGPMSAYEEDDYPWLIEEKQFIRRAIDNGKILLGICLGAQLIAEVLGSKVFKHSHSEIGWYPIQFTDVGRRHPFFKDFPDPFTPVHWHGDTYELPDDAVHICQSEGCKQQAFIWGDRVIGLQFHMEFSMHTLHRLIHKSQKILSAGGRYTQAEEAICDANRLESVNQIFDQFLQRLYEFYLRN